MKHLVVILVVGVLAVLAAESKPNVASVLTRQLVVDQRDAVDPSAVEAINDIAAEPEALTEDAEAVAVPVGGEVEQPKSCNCFISLATQKYAHFIVL